tara:strand:+ start:133 stop:657 length:525 start_codon:yes stop_codon:yes gene_type:complete
MSSINYRSGESLGYYCQENFLSDQECDILIDYHKNYPFGLQDYYGCKEIPEDYQINAQLKNRPHSKRIRKVRTPILKRLSSTFSLKLHHDLLVCWPPGSYKPMHQDLFIDWSSGLSSICYLNDDFGGGETVVGDTAIPPKKGAVLAFDGLHISHGVNLISEKPRYTYIAWWQEN